MDPHLTVRDIRDVAEELDRVTSDGEIFIYTDELLQLQSGVERARSYLLKTLFNLHNTKDVSSRQAQACANILKITESDITTLKRWREHICRDELALH